MKKLLLAAIMIGSIGTAMADNADRTRDGRSYKTVPNHDGRPEWGTTTTTPSGKTCKTMPNHDGHPEWGVTTTCN